MVKTNNFKSPFQATAAKFQSNLNNFVEILSQLIRFYGTSSFSVLDFEGDEKS